MDKETERCIEMSLQRPSETTCKSFEGRDGREKAAPRPEYYFTVLLDIRMSFHGIQRPLLFKVSFTLGPRS